MDLDSIIMSDKCCPAYVEENLNVSDEILFDAIRFSANQGWLLKLDVFDEFSEKFKNRLLDNFDAFTNLSMNYFVYQLEQTKRKSLMTLLMKHDFHQNSLHNPRNLMSSSSNIEYDNEILNGKITLRESLVNRIRKFMTNQDKKTLDFKSSLFLPEMMSPKFFFGLSEVEQLVILKNLAEYHRFLDKFRIGFTHHWKNEFNPAIILIRHILSKENTMTTNRVKMGAWKQLHSIGCGTHLNGNDKMFRSWIDVDKLFQCSMDIEKDKSVLKGYTSNDIGNLILDSDGVFDDFEIECTLRGLESSDFIYLVFSISPRYLDLIDNMIEFQDEEKRNELFDKISKIMKGIG